MIQMAEDFQFPLWDTQVKAGTIAKARNCTFNSLYGIPIKQRRP